MPKRLIYIILVSLFLLLPACGLISNQNIEASPIVSSPSPEITPSPVPESPSPSQEPADDAFVLITDYIPDIYVDLKYATADNFTGEVIYTFSQAYLRYGTVKKLAAAQSALSEQGYSLKVWDAYRPVYAQQALWDVCPDPNYVSNPQTGTSAHSRGGAVDVTLVTADGEELIMPTGFDDFSALADRDYSDVSAEASTNAKILENAMIAAGFNTYFKEWWHYSDTVEYEKETSFVPE
jgi:D-alanyl-D-alanine dipeptidase